MNGQTGATITLATETQTGRFLVEVEMSNDGDVCRANAGLISGVK